MVTIKSLRWNAVLESIRHIFLYGFIEIAVIGLIILLANLGFLDAKNAISVVLPEVALAVVLYYLLGERRRGRLGEVINLMEAHKKLSHLKVYTCPVFHHPFRFIYYYVENPITRMAYRAPSYIEEWLTLALSLQLNAEMKSNCDDFSARTNLNLL